MNPNEIQMQKLYIWNWASRIKATIKISTIITTATQNWELEREKEIKDEHILTSERVRRMNVIVDRLG